MRARPFRAVLVVCDVVVRVCVCVVLMQKRKTAMRQAELYAFNIRSSPLPNLFHIRDILGSDLLEEVDRTVLLPGQTTAENVYVRVAKKK